jgi:predicted lipoprotein with Yx(FWY)xxD motif
MRSKRLLVFVGIVSAVTLLTGVAFAASHTAAKRAATVTITTRTVPGLGRILVNANGYTLYMFVPDKAKKVTCVGGCAVAWPPVKAPAGAKLVGTGGVKASLLGSDSNPAGGLVVTYNHWPLYTYVADRHPGAAFGQAINVNGGLWYVLSPAGTVIKQKASTGTTTKATTTTTTSSCQDHDFDGDFTGAAPDDGDGCL